MDEFAKVRAQAARLERARAGHWRIRQTLPGTWDVQDRDSLDQFAVWLYLRIRTAFRPCTSGRESLMREAVWLYESPDRWACSCRDFAEGTAHRLGLRCTHIEAVRLNLPALALQPGQPLEFHGGSMLPLRVAGLAP